MATLWDELTVQVNILMNNKLAVLLLIIVVAIITWYFTKQHYSVRSTFMNKSPDGFYYDTDTHRFASKKDREIGITALLKIIDETGTTYTRQQLASLSDSIIISSLETEDGTELAEMKARIVLLVDPTYKIVLSAVNKASISGNIFKNDADRQMTYDLLVKYFNAKNTPIRFPLSRWTDVLLIKTFQTRRLPSMGNFN